MRKFLILLLIVPFLQGCGAALLAAGTGAAIMAGRYGEAKKIDSRSQAYKDYQEIVLEYERLNMEREEKGLKPKAVPTYEEWINIVSDKKVRKEADVGVRKDQEEYREHLKGEKRDGSEDATSQKQDLAP